MTFQKVHAICKITQLNSIWFQINRKSVTTIPNLVSFNQIQNRVLCCVYRYFFRYRLTKYLPSGISPTAPPLGVFGAPVGAHTALIWETAGFGGG